MTQITNVTKGVFVISVTPFTDDGTLDIASLDGLVDFYCDKGCDGLTILGMMGEAPKLTHRESIDISRHVIQRARGKPVIVGVSAAGLASMMELTAEVMELGAAGVMVAPPSNLRTGEQIVAYYVSVVETLGSDVPIVLQDFPLSTNVQISPVTLGTILESCPSIVMLKHEDWPGLAKISALREAERSGRRRTSILCGNGGMFLPEEMARGADGAMTGFAYPEMMAEVIRLAESGDIERAQNVFDIYLPLVRYEQQPVIGLAVRKYVLAKRGAIKSAAQRRPAAALDAVAAAEIDRLVARLVLRRKELT
jgi:4-hydroxy-tetrahydrodipicolinate synthase